MHCLFCKADSGASRSVEHIIPESLGNHTFVLPAGVVCDGCNNYFSRKVEKPFLESSAITYLRFSQAIPSKKGRVPPMDAIMAPGFSARIYRHLSSEIPDVLDLPPEGIEHLFRSRQGTLIMPAGAELAGSLIVSRFLAKVALEFMAYRLASYPDGLTYLTNEAQLDLIRDHARRGSTRDWPVSIRRIYDTTAKWVDENGDHVQLVHESDILQTDSGELYFVLAIFGLEFVINYGGPDIRGYEVWLSNNDNVSPLYAGKNARTPSLRSASTTTRHGNCVNSQKSEG